MEELIKKQNAIDALYYEQVSTNPTHFKSNEKFIEFMGDSDIASFGNWQWANGFNTALLAARIHLEKLPPVPQWLPCKERLPDKTGWYAVKVASSDDLRMVYGYESITVEQFDAWMELPEPWKGSEE